MSQRLLVKSDRLSFLPSAALATAWSDFAKIDFNEKTGVAALAPVLAKINLPQANKFDLGNNLVDADHNLFGGLRYFDDQDDIETIYVQGFHEGEESLAYMNRLNKAAGGHHFNK